MGLFGGILQGLGGILGSVVGAVDNSKAIKKASAAQQAGIDKAIGEQQRQYDLSRGDQLPFMDFGKLGLGPLGDLLGMNGPEAAQAAIDALKNSPMYQSLFNTGQEAILQNASATGGVRGGNTQGALYEHGANTLAQTIQQQIANLFGAVGIGQGSTTSVGQLGAHKADQVASGYTSIGNSKFNSILGRQGVYNDLGSQVSKILSSIPTGGF